MVPERIPTKDALGRIEAVDILSGEDLPFYDISEKDGYAVNHLSILNASTSSPVTLKVTQVITLVLYLYHYSKAPARKYSLEQDFLMEQTAS